MLSLEGALRTCKVDTSWANRIQSDRFENPELMVCPVWTGFDNAGRPVSADSYVTKTAGCNTPEDRVYVENALRPQYFQYVNLDAEGLGGNIYDTKNNMLRYDSNVRTQGLNQLNPALTGQWSNAPANDTIYPRCTTYPYELASKQQAQLSRQMQSLQHATKNNQYKRNSGF
jgi:hypothetical protein